MENKTRKEILKEQTFSYSNMTMKERDICLFYLSLCKEFRNTESNNSELTILQCNFTKNDNSYLFNGIGFISKNSNDENRCFDGMINIKDNKIEISTNITRLAVNDDRKEYSTIDIIKINGNKYNVETKYSYLNKKYIEQISQNNNDITNNHIK